MTHCISSVPFPRLRAFQTRARSSLPSTLAAAIVLGGLVPSASAQPASTFELLIPGVYTGEHARINDHGTIVAVLESSEGQTLWQYSDARGLEQLPVGVFDRIFGLGINNNGQVCFSSFTNGRGAAWRYDPEASLRNLGNLGYPYDDVAPYCADINDAGQVVGGAIAANGQVRAFRADGVSPMIDLGDLGAPNSNSFAMAIRNDGMVAGDTRAINNDTHAVLFTANGVQDLGTLGGDYSTTRGMNSLGHVVGVSAIGNGRTAPFLYTPESGMRAILPELNEPLSINDQDWITGIGEDGGFVWTPQDGRVWLHSLLPTDFEGGISDPYEINNHNQVVGFGGVNGQDGVVRLTIHAVPGCTTGIATFAPMMFLAARRRRR